MLLKPRLGYWAQDTWPDPGLWDVWVSVAGNRNLRAVTRLVHLWIRRDQEVKNEHQRASDPLYPFVSILVAFQLWREVGWLQFWILTYPYISYRIKHSNSIILNRCSSGEISPEVADLMERVSHSIPNELDGAPPGISCVINVHSAELAIVQIWPNMNAWCSPAACVKSSQLLEIQQNLSVWFNM